VIAQNFYIPEKVYFTMTFFDYPLFATDTVTYSEAGDARAVQTAVQEERTFVLVREKYLAKLTDQKEPVYIFDVDPSKSRYKNLHRDFIYYLNRKSLHIDVWDAENLMLYGTVKIPLRALRRAGRKEQSKVYKADILEPHFSRVKGYLQISLANFGYPCEVMAPEVAQTSTGFAGTASDVRNWNTVSDASKRRVKSTAPLQLPGTF
jgi:nephrocystin-4